MGHVCRGGWGDTSTGGARGCPSGTPRGMQHRRQRVRAATPDWNSAMTWGCESRATCGSLEGAALLAQAAEQASMSPGKDGEGTAHTQDSCPRRVSKSQTAKLCEPSGASTHRGAYAETTGTQKTPLESVCQGLDHHRLETMGTGLSWRQLCFGAVCGTAQGYQWVSQSLPGVSKVSPGAQGLASSAGDTQWQSSTSLYTTVCYVHHFSTAKFPHLDLQPE